MIPVYSIEQKPVLSPHMHLFTRLLQLPLHETIESVLNEIEDNPVLEVVYHPQSFPKQETVVESSPSLFEHLMRQASEVFTKEELKIAERLIGNVDEKGFLDIEVSDPKELSLLKTIQLFDPVGICAKDAREALLIQLEEQGKLLGYHLIKEHYAEFLEKRWDRIRDLMGGSESALLEILSVTPFPGLKFKKSAVQYATPEIVIAYEDEKWSISHPKEHYPSFHIKPEYLTLATHGPLLRKRVSQGKQLISILYKRASFFHKAAAFFIERQGDYLRGASNRLLPLSTKEFMKALSCSPSMASRALSHKYIDTPRGLIPFYNLFSQKVVSIGDEEISRDRAKEILLDLICNEDRKKPLSDQALTVYLEQKGIKLSRRAIAKYRSELQIPSSHLRN